MGPWKTDLSSKKSVRVQANVNILAQESACQYMAHSSSHKKKDLHVKAYHPPAVQALKAPDAAKRVKWAEDFRDAVMLDLHILWTEEAIFHLNGTVPAQCHHPEPPCLY